MRNEEETSASHLGKDLLDHSCSILLPLLISLFSRDRLFLANRTQTGQILWGPLLFIPSCQARGLLLIVLKLPFFFLRPLSVSPWLWFGIRSPVF